MKGQSPQEAIIKCFNEQFIKTIEKIFGDSDEMNREDIIEKFNNLSVTSESSTGKKNKPGAKKEVPTEERCIALKNDKTRCGGRKQKDNELCSLHKKSGAKNGLWEASEEKSDAEPEPVPEPKKRIEPTPKKESLSKASKTCIHRYAKGENKGKDCGNLATVENYCKFHKPKKSKFEPATSEFELDDSEDEMEDDFN